MTTTRSPLYLLGCLGRWLVLVVLLIPASAAADSYGVQATVPYPPSTQAAIFDSGFDATTLYNSTLTLTGTCEPLNPQGAVVIMRGPTNIGSSPCDGTFSVGVVLTAGANNLVARTVNASGLYGPDSSPIVVTYVPPTPPPTPTPTSPPDPTPSTNTSPSLVQLNRSINAGVATSLEAMTVAPYGVIDDSKSVNVDIVVSGGDNPYTIELEWGDGTGESHTVASPGTYTYQHVYKKQATYQVHGKVTDILGAATQFDYAVVSNKQSVTPPNLSGNTLNHTGATGGDTISSTTDSIYQHLTAFSLTGLAICCGLLLLLLGYHVGMHRALHRRLLVASKKRRKKREYGADHKK